MGRREQRAADSDRAAVAERLRAAVTEGRLDLDEYDQRVRQAYATTSYADLARLTADLPPPARPGVPPAAPAPVRLTLAWLACLPIGCLVMLAVLIVLILT